MSLTLSVASEEKAVVPLKGSVLVALSRMNLPTRDWSAGMEKVLVVPLVRLVQPSVPLSDTCH